VCEKLFVLARSEGVVLEFFMVFLCVHVRRLQKQYF
jgi:hypothetical protein